MKLNVTTNQVRITAALFFALFTNVAFFRNLLNAFADSDQGYLHILSLGMVQICLLVIA